MAESQATVSLVTVQVELFGLAQLVCDRRQVAIDVPGSATIADVVAALAKTCPALVGMVIRHDLSGLHESYILNLNGLTFVAQGCLTLQSGDTLLLFSSQAGG
jgi:hypothetical protein